MPSLVASDDVLPPILPELAAFLGARREQLIGIWVEALRQNRRAGRVPAVDDPGLIDHLPHLFDDLVATLRGEPAGPERTSRDAHEHGQTRWEQRYTLSEVLQELGIVSRLLFEHGLDAFADAHAGTSRAALRRAREALAAFFEDGAAGSARQYAFRQQEQTDAAHQEVRRLERQQAAAVQSEYERLANMFQRAPSFLALLRGPDHTFHLANDQYRRITGHRELIGKPVREALSEVVAQGYLERLDRVYTTGEPMVGNDVRILLQSAPGAPPKEHFIDFVYLPTRAPDGSVDGILVHGVDWTARKVAEQTAGRLSEQRRLALDSARMGWWHMDLVSGELQMDERFRAIFDVDERGDAYTQVLGRIHPEDRERVDAAVQAAICSVDPAPYAIGYRVVHRDGSLHWVAAEGQASYEGEGSERRMVGFSGTAADTTEEKLAHEKLSQSEAKYRSLFDSIDQAFAVLDIIRDADDRPVDYRFMEVNPAMERHTGWQDSRGKTARELISNLEDHWPETYGRVERTGESIRFVQGAEGMGRVFDAYAFRIGSSEHPQVAILFQDVTAAKAAQKALLESEGKFRELAESERAARTQAERTSQMKDEFLATLSHELRTPLNAILGWTQVLRDDPANSEDTASGLATIERNAKAQTQIIEDLLDMSKIISGKVRLDVQPLKLDEVVAAAVETMRPAATAKNIRLQSLIDPQARMISGDPNRLQQVFWNLLTNAIKFTPKGGKVQVVLERVHSHLEVAVADTGEGIAPEFLPYVFDRFRQQDASTARKHGGLGLGLAIVKQLVELHGGSIRVESAGLGQGATFGVILPLSVVQPAREQADPERRHPQSEGAALSVPAELLDLAGVKVLVVDDEPDARALVKRLLVDRKATVRTAGSVAEALTVLQAERPDVLVSDIGMPEEDGYTLIRRVRALAPEVGGSTPAIALTAYARAEDRLNAILSGFQMHVSKPVNAVELLALVASLAGRAKNL